LSFGVRINERMAGTISFSELPSNSTQIQTGVEYPFEINIKAFCERRRYPFPFRFIGNAYFPGLPLNPKLSESHSRPYIEGDMGISHDGVSYDFPCHIEGLGTVVIKGMKKYIFKTYNPKIVIDSLITLPIEVSLDGKTIGGGLMHYLNPLYHFPFGVRVTSKELAYNPRGPFSKKLLSLVPIITPNWEEIAKKDDIEKRILEQMIDLPYFTYKAMVVCFYLITFITVLKFRRSLSKLSSAQKEKLCSLFLKHRFFHILILPLLTNVIGAIYSQKSFFEKTDQNIPEPPVNAEEENWMQLVQTPITDLSKEEVEVDVVVVGSGAGGAALAYELARLGNAVAVVEEGHYFKRPDFTGDRIEMMHKLYRNGGRSFALSNAPLWIPTGKAVGGTTVINSGTSMRPKKEMVEKWGDEIGGSLTDLEKYIPQVEQMLGNNPVEEKIQGEISKVLDLGTKKLGLKYHPLKRAEIGCDGQSYCILGCPISAKRSTDVSYMAEALKNNAFLFTHYRANSLIIENGKAVGIRAGLENYGENFSLNIKAKVVVLAAGTLGTPHLLYKNGLHSKNKNIGQNLTIHPAINLGGIFPYINKAKLFAPQSLHIDDETFHGFVLEGYTIPIDSIPLAFSCYGKELTYLMKNAKQFTNFASMMSDSVKGHLILKKWGSLPSYKIDRSMNQIIRNSSKMIAKILLEAEASRVYTPISGLEKVTKMEQLSYLDSYIPAYNFTLSAHHPLGTCKMGKNPQVSVVDEHGEFWGVKNLFIADGSTIPGPLGVNPQVTIMSNALRIANFIQDTRL
jgi:choline dehydrogenase-like flavoprotein